MTPEVILEGKGLHSGRHCTVTLTAHQGPTIFGAEGKFCPLHKLAITRTDLGVSVAIGENGPVVDLVEHLFSAIGALGYEHGLSIQVSGGEIPILDGASSTFCRALATFQPQPQPRPKIVTPSVWQQSGCRYEFIPADSCEITVFVDFDHPAVGAQSAYWDGTASSYLSSIAPARTFGFQRDAEKMIQAGRARGADPSVIVVMTDRGFVDATFVSSDEPARHKLLDLIGDLTLAGGIPLGRIIAHRPGHSATAAAIKTVSFG